MKTFSMILAMTVVLGAAPALASGSGSGYSGGGVSNPQPRDPRAEAFNSGKSMFKKRIACKTCAYSGGVNDGETAREVAAKVQAGQFNLKADERQAVLYYMSERYGIRI